MFNEIKKYMNYMYSGFIYERKKYIVSEGKKVCVRSKLNCFLNLIIVVVFIRNICYRFNRGEFYYWFCNSFKIKFFIWKIRVWIFKGDVYLFLIIFFLLRYFIFVYLVCITMYVFGCFFCFFLIIFDEKIILNYNDIFKN